MIFVTTIFIIFALIGFYTVADCVKRIVKKYINKNIECECVQDVESQGIS